MSNTREKGGVDMYITNFEMILTFEDGTTHSVEMTKDEKKIFISMLLKFYKDGVQFKKESE